MGNKFTFFLYCHFLCGLMSLRPLFCQCTLNYIRKFPIRNYWFTYNWGRSWFTYKWGCSWCLQWCCLDGWCGVGVQSMTSTSFPFKAIGKQGLEHGVSTGSCRTGATGAFLGVCNSAACMDGVGISMVDCSGGTASVSVSFVTEKAIWN